jgi:hypothetical protein
MFCRRRVVRQFRFPIGITFQMRNIGAIRPRVGYEVRGFREEAAIRPFGAG